MNENWCALCIAIIEHTTPEKAFEFYNKGKREVNKTITQEDVEDMIRFKEEGMTYAEIGEMYGVNCDIVFKRIRYYKKKRGKEKLCI